jgi:hypothetical protein
MLSPRNDDSRRVNICMSKLHAQVYVEVLHCPELRSYCEFEFEHAIQVDSSTVTSAATACTGIRSSPRLSSIVQPHKVFCERVDKCNAQCPCPQHALLPSSLLSTYAPGRRLGIIAESSNINL